MRATTKDRSTVFLTFVVIIMLVTGVAYYGERVERLSADHGNKVASFVVFFENITAAAHDAPDQVHELVQAYLLASNFDCTVVTGGEAPQDFTWPTGCNHLISEGASSSSFFGRTNTGHAVEVKINKAAVLQDVLFEIAVLLLSLTVMTLAFFALWQRRRQRLTEDANLQVKDAADKLRAIMNNVVDGILTLDDKGNILTANPAAERMFGTSRLIGENVASLIAFDGDQNPFNMSAAAGSAVCNGTGLCSSGSNFPLEFSLGESRVSGRCVMTMVLRDVTASQKSKETLIEAKIKAEEANAAKSRFLAMMSHEIRTPMNGVLGVLELLKDTVRASEERQLIETGLDSGHGLLQVINDILDFSKMEAGKMMFENIEFELRSVIGTVEGLAHQLRKDGNFDIHFHVDEKVPEFYVGDPGRLKQVLLNLVSNAVKFTDAGHVNMRVERVAGMRGAPLLRFEVDDTGAGISEDDLGNLFKEFSTLGDTHSRKAGGTGLGLVICQKLVTIMGGEIGCRSKIGKGSTFWFTVNLPEVANSNRRPKKSIEARPCSMTTSSPTEKHVLIVDDDETSALIARAMLEREGFKVSAVSTGLGIIEAVTRTKPDIILMDIEMPVVDGPTAAGKIRSSRHSFSDIAIIAMSAHQPDEKRDIVHAARMNDYVSKPFNRGDLLRAIYRWVGPDVGGQTDTRRPLAVCVQ